MSHKQRETCLRIWLIISEMMGGSRQPACKSHDFVSDAVDAFLIVVATITLYLYWITPYGG